MTESRLYIFIKFVFFGCPAFVVNILSRWILFHFIPYVLSIIIAYLLGFIVAFISFKYFVFKQSNSGRTLREIALFLFVNVISLTQTVIISSALAYYFFPFINFTFYPYDISHFLGICSTVITSYFLHKNLTFKNTITS
ncbi:MAG: GtrA family protein [Deltaproteobacteria bacterium]|nr:GtrA family protein [Deltaproteobacteria bacterium]